MSSSSSSSYWTMGPAPVGVHCHLYATICAYVDVVLILILCLATSYLFSCQLIFVTSKSCSIIDVINWLWSYMKETQFLIFAVLVTW